MAAGKMEDTEGRYTFGTAPQLSRTWRNPEGGTVRDMCQHWRTGEESHIQRLDRACWQPYRVAELHAMSLELRWTLPACSVMTLAGVAPRSPNALRHKEARSK